MYTRGKSSLDGVLSDGIARLVSNCTFARVRCSLPGHRSSVAPALTPAHLISCIATRNDRLPLSLFEHTMAEKKEHVVFFHPDLGIGGAERLVIDAAVGLQNRGHKVTIFTSHCDPQHCFDEARDGKPLLQHLGPPAAYAWPRS